MDLAMPAPTRDLDQATEDVKEFGFTVIEGALSSQKLGEVREALYRAAAADRARGREQKFALDYESDSSNQRIWNVLSRDPVFTDLIEHPHAIEMVRRVIGWPALLSNVSANITGPGGGEMVLHADQLYMPTPWCEVPQGMNIAWCVDDFTEENGATRIVPGSHKCNRPPDETEQNIETVAMEAPAGSMIVFESRLWHKTGNNRMKSGTRAGIFAWYTTPIYRQQENWYLSLDPSVRQFASEDLLILLGLKTEGLGLVNGKSPA